MRACAYRPSSKPGATNNQNVGSSNIAALFPISTRCLVERGHTFTTGVARHQLNGEAFRYGHRADVPAGVGRREGGAGQGETSAERRSDIGPGARGWSGGPLKRASA